MTTLSTVPMIVDLKAYGGDTFTLMVTAAAEVTDGMVWNAEIRATREVTLVDAVFTITPPAVSGGPAYLVLSAEDSGRLASGSPVVNRRDPNGITRAVKQYSGVWDCQVSNDLTDPVRTLVQGAITIELDVTRPT